MHDKDLGTLREAVLAMAESLRVVAANLEKVANIVTVIDAGQEANAPVKGEH